ncbi:helix-turn-helix domain-containing protein [Shigella flexneri]
MNQRLRKVLRKCNRQLGDAPAQWADRALRSGHQNLLSEAQPELERTLLTTALRHTQGHKQEAARLLGWATTP